LIRIQVVMTQPPTLIATIVATIGRIDPTEFRIAASSGSMIQFPLFVG
jgi:hypothetical protein